MKKTDRTSDHPADAETKSNPDEILVNDSTGRRRFIRSGAVFLLAGSGMAKAGPRVEAGGGQVERVEKSWLRSRQKFWWQIAIAQGMSVRKTGRLQAMTAMPVPRQIVQDVAGKKHR